MYFSILIFFIENRNILKILSEHKLFYSKLILKILLIKKALMPSKIACMICFIQNILTSHFCIKVNF